MVYFSAMPKRSSKKKGKKVHAPDVNEVAANIVKQATSEVEEGPMIMTPDGRNAAAVALGRLGGKKGGPARAAKLTAEERSDIARRGAEARWKKGE